MMKYFALFLIIVPFTFSNCDTYSPPQTFSLAEEVCRLPSIEGKRSNGNYLYVTAGSALYSIGNQNGKFQPVGFHVSGEMGGVWQHPIKLLDGYSLSICDEGKSISVDTCESFISYPFASQFKYTSDGLKYTRTEFVPDSMPVLVVEYQIYNIGKGSKDITLSFLANTDVSPVWLGERSGMIDTRDQFEGLDENIAFVKDSLNSWYVGIAADVDTIAADCEGNSPVQGKGLSVALGAPQLSIAAGEVKNFRFYISGSIKNKAEIKKNLQYVKANLRKLYFQKKQRYEDIDRIAAITIPDTLLMQAYQWGKYNSDWLVRDVPNLGKGMSAGLPDYPWFFSNDQSATFEALVGTRDPNLFYHSMKMLKIASDKVNNNSGRIIHEMSSNGVVYDNGRMEESQEFIIASWNVFKWTGNIDFLQIYYEHGKRLWKFLEEHDTDHNLYVEGPGGAEIEGLNDEMLDVAVQTQVFLDVMSQAALVFGELNLSKQYAEKATLLKRKINEDWWVNSEGRYADFMADKQKAIQLIDMTLKKRVTEDRNQWARKKLVALREQILRNSYKETGYVVFYNASSILPLQVGIADTNKALQMLDSMSFFTNKFGLYVAGIDRPDDITSEESSVIGRSKDFNYNAAIMQIATSNLVMSECRYRGFVSARKYIAQMLNNFSYATPGTTYEVSPDYGQIVQAWNICGINIPMIHYLFGVDPMAYKQKINIKTDIPEEWEYAKLDNLMVGNNFLSIDYKKTGERKIFIINCTENGWKIHFSLPAGAKDVEVNGQKLPASSIFIDLQGMENRVEMFY